MANLITIDQLLESVDLDFEPRFVTKNKNGGIYVWATRPRYRSGVWFGDETVYSYIAKLKLAEFEGKSSDGCIYEVPRKEEPKDKIKIGTLYMDKGVTFGDGDDDDVGFVEDYEVPRKTTGKIEKLPTSAPFGCQGDWREKINEIIDWINENYKDAK